MTEGWFTHVDNLLDYIRLRSLIGRQFCAEVLGTFILVVSTAFNTI